MDERIFVCKAGLPIPTWDLRHRLPVFAPVGSECKDTATIFRINSTFMDVTDQPYRYRHMTAGGALTSFFFAVVFCVIGVIVFMHRDRTIDAGFVSYSIFVSLSLSGFSYFAFKIGREEFFSLKRRPIRFNRMEQKIYSVRRRRYFDKPDEGDITWEVPWNADSIFCIHKNDYAAGNCYHIRHYTVDEQGNVLRAFAIGREWEGDRNLQGLLSQWNYWCEYMNQGPANLPSPALFFREKEDVRETFLFCTYALGFQAVTFSYILSFPLLLLATSFRLLALWTCRDPVWPRSVDLVSAIEPGDAFDQPRGDTPTGWADTGTARRQNKWPLDPKRAVPNWRGEPDPAKNALLWAKDVPPVLIAEAE